jgi:membrane-bound lytic murein transglycosylase D
MSTSIPLITVECLSGDVPAFRRSFASGFRIGRGTECDLRVEADPVSRTHAEVFLREGGWWVRDLNSTNGTWLDGERLTEAPLRPASQVQLGRKGPVLRFLIGEAAEGSRPPAPAPDQKPAAGASEDRVTTSSGSSSTRVSSTQTGSPPPPGGPAAGASRTGGAPKKAGGRDPSIDHYIEHYMKAADDADAGEHTIMIRRAFATVQKKEKRRYRVLIAAAVALAVVLGGWAVVSQVQIRRQHKAAAALFTEMKTLDLQIAQLRTVIENTGNAELSEQLDRLEKSRRQMARRYDGYINDLGVYRRLNDNEKVIYRMARVFNESEFGMPAEFADSVLYMIRTYWQTPAGRARFTTAIREAEDNGYTDYIVRVMQRYGLPPQLFYLALQESNFNPKAIGPSTRWGRAKGMWQFIPATASRYGLDPGPYANEKIADPQDERLEFQKATRAAARYLQDVYGTLAQASGLLVVASYNWGEHRIANKLERLTGPQTIPAEALEGIPEDPSSRNYWTFLGAHRDRMPRETKDYVLKIFSAAVIGENPRRFGFDMDNPLKPYLEVEE